MRFQKAWYWRDDAVFRAVVINVLEEVGKAFGTDFSPYITDLCPYLLTVVQADNAKEKTLTSQVCTCSYDKILDLALGLTMRQIYRHFAGSSHTPHSTDTT